MLGQKQAYLTEISFLKIYLEIEMATWLESKFQQNMYIKMSLVDKIVYAGKSLDK